MYRALFAATWKSMGPLVLLLALATFALPLWQLAAVTTFGGGPGIDLAVPLLSAIAATDFFYPMGAYVCGLLIGGAIWWDDIQGKHVYALSLPLPRWYYVLLRMSTGLTMIGILAAALLVSALLTAAQVNLPPGVHAYPGGLAVRFALASTVTFMIAFSLASASPRTLRILGISVSIFVVYVLVAESLEFWSPAQFLVKAMQNWPGIADAFTGRWMLFDV